jgi:hypothetical protein
MKVRIIDRVHHPRTSGIYPIGEVVEMDSAAAARLIAIGCAEPVDEPKPVAEAPLPPPPQELPQAEPEPIDRGPLGLVDANVIKSTPRVNAPKSKR